MVDQFKITLFLLVHSIFDHDTIPKASHYNILFLEVDKYHNSCYFAIPASFARLSSSAEI